MNESMKSDKPGVSRLLNPEKRLSFHHFHACQRICPRFTVSRTNCTALSPPSKAGANVSETYWSTWAEFCSTPGSVHLLS